ncbi:hypothetical protein H2200_008336 [Cladophialophora chaetospira]|uniref:Transcription factor domain-containing protein n=1 Tax=Cladophialophora chaetospira TaxID=386627 RepID=A0AA38X5K2_9EURO|nr:hypothetical protein H2200_008336 [Cladophialophora chaetospira]
MPAHNRGGLLFVNKTPSSRSLSNSKTDTEDLKEIHKHVQKSRDYGKEKEDRKRLKRARLSHIRWTPVPVAPRQAPTAAARPIPLPETAVSNGSRPPAIEFDVNQREEFDHELCKHGRRKDDAPKLLLAPSGRGSLEPFGQLTISTSTEKRRILEYYVVRFFPAVTRVDVGSFMSHSQASSTKPAVEIVRRAQCNDLHVLALLSASCARMKFVEQVHFSQPDLPDRLADATLRLLRRYLAQDKPITHELVQSILHLWAVESYRRNWEAVGTHAKMIMYLTDSHLGGFRSLDPFMQRMLWVADRFQAAALQRAPLIREQWEVEGLSPQEHACALAALHENGKQPMGYGFHQARNMFTPSFRLLLEDVLALCCVIHCHWLNVPEQPLIPSRNWIIARSYFVTDELIGFERCEVKSSPPTREIQMQDCVRLALVVWMAFVPACTSYSTYARIPKLRAAVDTKALRNALGVLLTNRKENSTETSEQLALFWIAGLGAIASEMDENQEWFAVQFQRMAKRLGVFSWDAFMPVQERFLMLDTLKLGNLTRLTWLLQRAVHADVGG